MLEKYLGRMSLHLLTKIIFGYAKYARLRFRIVGTFSANLWLDIQVTGEEETFLTGPVFSFGQGQHARIPVNV